MKHTQVVSTKYTPGFACRAFSDTTLVCFIVNEHTTKCSRYINTHAPLFRGGADHVYESLGDSCLVMNIHNPFMHCVTSQYVFKPRDVIMLTRAVTIVAA